MKIILLIMIGLNVFLSAVEISAENTGSDAGENANFTKSTNIVTDSTTGLQWQDNNDTNGTERTWQEAINYCEALSLDTHDDWRLPNINELKTLIDRRKKELAIVDGFEYIGTNNYYDCWSSTSFVGHEYSAWIVGFYDGYVGGHDKDGDLYVRCVRDGQ